MFKDYKALFRNLRETQEKLWSEASGLSPGAQLPPGIDAWQQNLLGNINDWAREAVGQSLGLQRAWLVQWSGRAAERKVKPKVFAELNAEAQQSAQRWIGQQHDLWRRWLGLLQQGGAHFPGQDQFDTALQEVTQRQMELLGEWSRMSEPESLSMKEMQKLVEHMSDALQQSIEAQHQLWSFWFDEFQKAAQVMGETSVGETDIQAAPPTRQAAKPTARPKPAAKPRAAAPAAKPPASEPADDDLKQISGIGPALEQKLKARGYTSFAQIAALTDAQVAELEKTVIRFPGRIMRDDWIGQAKKRIG